MTALGPLTTIFRAPSSCTTTTPQIYQIWTGKESRYEQGPLFTSGSNCFPSGYNPLSDNYYSPGFCPHGYTAACTRTGSQRTATQTETALICCPTALSYTCPESADSASWGCTMTLDRAVAVVGVTVISDGVTSDYTTVTESKGGFAAHSVQVRFREGDPVPLTAADSSSVTAAGKTGSPTAGTLSLPTQTTSGADAPSPAQDGAGVSTMAAIGIGVGSAIGALLIAGAVGLFFFLRWRRKRGRTAPPPRPPVPPKDPTRASTYTNGVVPSVFELSEEASSPRMPKFAELKRDLTGRSRRRSGTIVTSRTSRTGISEELEMSGFLHSKAVELEAPSLLEPSIRSGREKTAVDRERGGANQMRESTPESVSSSSWTVMRKDGVVATPWL